MLHIGDNINQQEVLNLKFRGLHTDIDVYIKNAEGKSIDPNKIHEPGIHFIINARPGHYPKIETRKKLYTKLEGLRFFPPNEVKGFKIPEKLNPNESKYTDWYGRTYGMAIDTNPKTRVVLFAIAPPPVFLPNLYNVMTGLTNTFVDYLLETAPPIEKYVKWKSRINNKKLESGYNQIKCIQNDLNKLETQMQQKIKALKDAEILQKRMEEQTKDVSKFEREYNKIKNLKDVEELDFNDNTLIIKTKTILSPRLPDNTRRELGKYQIKIKPGTGIMPSMQYIGSPPTQNLWMHPHIDAYGSVCWGGYRDPVYRALLEEDYQLVLTYCLMFLNDCNPQENWGRYVYYFPIFPEDDYPQQIVDCKKHFKCGCGETDYHGASGGWQWQNQDYRACNTPMPQCTCPKPKKEINNDLATPVQHLQTA